MKWISVKEALPEVELEVLGATDDGQVGLVYYGDPLWYDYDGQLASKKLKITHWMPLPEPPKDK